MSVMVQVKEGMRVEVDHGVGQKIKGVILCMGDEGAIVRTDDGSLPFCKWVQMTVQHPVYGA